MNSRIYAKIIRKMELLLCLVNIEQINLIDNCILDGEPILGSRFKD